MGDQLKLMVKYSFLVLIIIIIQGYGCIEKERVGLLEIKSFFLSYLNKSAPFYKYDPFPDWVEKGDCCEWMLVRCNLTTGLVVELTLDFISFKDTDNSSHVLNASLFRPFQQLQILDLSDNHFSRITNITDLRNLRALNLASNKLNNSLLIQELCKGNSELEELNINSNELSGQFPQCLTNLTSLKSLDISSNHFTGNIPTTISNLTSIELLGLYDNYFEGLFSLSSIANLTKLKIFLLSSQSSKLRVETENQPFLPTFQLKYLMLRNCNLNSRIKSNIPSFLLSQYDLIFVDLSHNKLVGVFPFWLLQNNSFLENLVLTNNSLTGTLDQLPTLKHYLFVFQISRNNFSGQLPHNIGSLLPEVVIFNISRNNFEGNLPSSLEKNGWINTFDASNNKFSGKLRLSMFRNGNRILLGNNNFSGSIEDEMLNSTRFYQLDISNNMVSGRIPSWIGNLSSLQSLQLSENHFNGELPTGLCSLQSLIYLDVSQNRLSGYLPSCFNLSILVFLNVRRNNISGPIPRSLSRSLGLKGLDLSYNRFSGHIPNWLSIFTDLQFLLLKENRLQGPIPEQLCQLGRIRIMDLSVNKFSGSIPSCLSNLSFGNIRESEILLQQTSTGPTFVALYLYRIIDASIKFEMYMEENIIFSERQVEVDFTTKSRSNTYKGDVLMYMSGLDLSKNEFSGHIPLSIGNMLQIHALNFSHNNLTGGILKTFSNLKQLESLDLSHNLLSGGIPSQLSDLNFLAFFDVSYNNLSGVIPTSQQFQTFPASNYIGNPLLCGPPVEKNCSTHLMLPPSTQSSKEDGNQTTIDLVAFSWSFVASYVTILLAFGIVLYVNPHWRRMWFYFIGNCCSYFCDYF